MHVSNTVNKLVQKTFVQIIFRRKECAEYVKFV